MNIWSQIPNLPQCQFIFVARMQPSTTFPVLYTIHNLVPDGVPQLLSHRTLVDSGTRSPQFQVLTHLIIPVFRAYDLHNGWVYGAQVDATRYGTSLFSIIGLACARRHSIPVRSVFNAPSRTRHTVQRPCL